MGPLKTAEPFLVIQLGVLVAIVAIAWIFFRPKSPESGFGLRESDRPKADPKKGSKSAQSHRPNLLHHPREARILLSGFKADLPPHELLGVPLNADEPEIRRAFREKMKQYHPDRVAPAGTPEWREAQKISQTLEEARGKMLASLTQKTKN
jgi:hypothetical protein